MTNAVTLKKLIIEFLNWSNVGFEHFILHPSFRNHIEYVLVEFREVDDKQEEL